MIFHTTDVLSASPSGPSSFRARMVLANRSVRRAVVACAVVAAASIAGASEMRAQSNVALGRTVTGIGTFGGNANRDGQTWPNPAPAPFSSLTDGAVVPDGTQWQTGTVWWDREVFGIPFEDPMAFFDTRLEIDLGEVFMLTGAGFSFDNNDSYGFFTRNDPAEDWLLWFDVFCETCAPGMVSDRFVDDPFFYRSARYIAVSAFEGDGWYSLSEIEVYAATVPEPMSALLLVAGLGGLAVRARKRNV